MDLAIEAVIGARLAWTSELDPDASAVLEHRWPGVPNHGDLTAMDWAAVEPVDVLAAGFPCQPVSAAGRRAGINDERWLWDDITAGIGRMDPPPHLLVFENIPGLLTANGGDAMARVVEALAALGYMGRYRLLRASDVGAPHRRERVFIIAWAVSDTSGMGRRPRPGLRPADPVGLGQRRPGDHCLAVPADAGRFAGEEGVDWGPYEAAIRRWERFIGRPAPSPTRFGRNGRPRLNPVFVEWLMGLEHGHVTDVPGLSINSMLRILGNGVIPRQAAAALRLLLHDL